ncbi:MAG: hypothetical protein KDJ17_04265 [Hyphomicrobiaceae bacterium]|nr:hypothetical protein [Hyphomicrobiaceae bacterium]
MSLAFMAFNVNSLLTLVWPALLSAALWALVVWTLRQDGPPSSVATRLLGQRPAPPAKKNIPKDKKENV